MLAFLRTVLLLAWSLVRVTVARVLGRHRGLAAFRASYRADDLLSLTVSERAFVDDARGCIACGLCALGDLPAGARAELVTPMNLFLASSRSMPDYGVAMESFAQVDEAELERLEAECPARVPMRDLVRFVRAKGSAIARPR
jgi:hypothetical protein